MGETFACPECGTELHLKGLTPGRQVRCGWCDTSVEVPYLPRAARRGAHGAWGSRPAWVPWAWALLAVMGVVIVGAGSRRTIRAREQARVEHALADLTTAAEEAERAGQFDQARASFDEALGVAGQLRRDREARLDTLRKRRDEVTRRWARGQLDAAATLDATRPSQAVALSLSVLTRAKQDHALDDLGAEVRERLDGSRLRWVEQDLAAARRAVDADKFVQALDICERLEETASNLAAAVRQPFQKQADALVSEIISRRGVVLEPTIGSFTFGTTQSYDQALHPMLSDHLRQHGYVVKPAGSSWQALWDSRAPYRVTVTLVEAQGSHYLQSKNRLSVLSFRAKMTRDGRAIWEEGPTTARTQVPVPSLPAYLASRVAVGNQRSEAFERILYENARAALLARFGAALRNIPETTPRLDPR